MKCLTNCFGKAATVALSVIVITLTSQAQFSTPGPIVTLTSGNSTAMVNVGGNEGMFSWVVDGTSHLNSQWFWYRTGTVGGEAPINMISAPAITTPNGYTLYSYYANQQFSLQVDYMLTGGLLGSGTATINESIRISNLTGSPLDFHFFQYSDFDLNGTPMDSLVALNRSGWDCIEVPSNRIPCPSLKRSRAAWRRAPPMVKSGSCQAF